MWADSGWMGSRKTSGENKKTDLWSGWLFTHLWSHVTSFVSTCPTVKERKCEFFFLSGSQSLRLIHNVSKSVLTVYLRKCAYTCSKQPWSISDGFEIHMFALGEAQYKWSSQAELSSLTGCARAITQPWSAGSPPPSLWDRQEEKWAEINNQTAKFKVKRERGRRTEGRNGELEQNRKMWEMKEWWNANHLPGEQRCFSCVCLQRK